MQRTLRKFVPAFLQKLDREWMLNRPYLWGSKIHYVLFYGLLGLGASMTFGQLQPISVAQIPISTSFLIILGIPTLMALAYWWYRLSLVFNNTPHDKNIWRRNLGIIMIGSLLLISIPVSGWMIMEWRAMEVRNTINRLEDTKTLHKGVYLFGSSLNPKLNYTYQDGKSPERSWLYSYGQNDAARDFIETPPLVVAQDFLAMAHRYIPESYPISPEELVSLYNLKHTPPNISQDQLWQWRQDLMGRINYWEKLGIFNPFKLHSAEPLPSLSAINWNKIYPGILIFLIPILGLGLSLIYLGFRSFLALVVSLMVFMGLAGMMAQFMSYRVDIEEFFYGMCAIGSFFALYFGFSSANLKPWQQTAQKISLFVGLFGIYGLLLFAESVLFDAYGNEPPSVLIMTGVLILMSVIWLGPIRNRINYLQTAPSTL